MNEKILIKKDSYLNIQKSESDGKISITIEPVIEFNPKDGDFVTIDVASTIEFSDDCITRKLIGILKGSLDTGYYDVFPIYAGIAMDKSLHINSVFGNNTENVVRESTETEKNELLDMLKKEGKRWNAEKLCIEDIPKQRFKPGDKVRIKDGISSETLRSAHTYISEEMDIYAREILTVNGYGFRGRVLVDECSCSFSEDCLELSNKSTDWAPAPEDFKGELKPGDLCIFWENTRENAFIRIFEGKKEYSGYSDDAYIDNCGFSWKHAVKFESKEQLEKVRRGEL